MRRIPLLAGLASLRLPSCRLAAASAQTAALSGKSPPPKKARWKACWSAPRRPAPPSPSRSSATRTAATASRRASSSPASTRSASAPSATTSTTARAIEVAAQKTTTHDLKLRKTEDLAAQLSNGEWINSIPGNDPRKGMLLNCVGCHTLERVMRSKHNADDFMNIVLPRMQGYVNQSIPQHPQLRRGERLMEERGDPARADLSRRRRISGRRQSQREAAVELRPRPVAAAGRPRHPRDLHGIRSAARHHLAA